MLPPSDANRAIEKTVREEWGRILAALVAHLGDLELAEDCLQAALISALNHWQKNGLPHSPAAWLITTARRKAIDDLRRRASFREKEGEISYLIDLENEQAEEMTLDAIPDKRLEMIFTCCHPAFDSKSRVALTLRTLGGLTTEEIARAFLDKPATMAQRLVRAKEKIRKTGIPYKIPDSDILPERINSVLSVLYLIFNEGYSASSGDDLLRHDLSDEAIRLARIIHHLMPEETELVGLLALMLNHDARRYARTDGDGQMIALEHQNRRRWDQSKIKAGAKLVEATLSKQRLGPYQLQAAISAVHNQSPSWEETDWVQIEALYCVLHSLQPSPIVRINQAVAMSYSRSIDDALRLLDQVAAEEKSLETYQPYFAARADLLQRKGDHQDADTAFVKAIELTDNAREKAFLTNKMAGGVTRH